MSKKTSNVPVTRETGASRSPLGSWSGFSNLRDEMERLFDAFEPGLWFDRTPAVRERAGREWPLSPAIDLTENGEGYAVTAELPGLDPEAIKIKVSNGMMTISGEKTEEKREEDESHHLSERRWGSFQRSIRIPEDVDRDKIDAAFSKGVLTIHLPKSKEAKSSEKTIAIKAA
ncbi:Hsp20/alpha crystallin family protein [Histidinibacterium aquaticum]|uniref:Hsp20/alpha crystallin family protein n=1 Tax=Histidinibacterium aquaticum TaxID=2613962 RepID=A0A5J5GF92_9RHOB|nr:Hsp20/alpha crystallin family protein [Histidinibacterium aquaticum]KAA9006707.1 Hsp20/alpha crystallin family protein [Histidinibacterium aquaticum]